MQATRLPYRTQKVPYRTPPAGVLLNQLNQTSQLRLYLFELLGRSPVPRKFCQDLMPDPISFPELTRDNIKACLVFAADRERKLFVASG
jgi:hypothetical protein